MKPEWKVLKNPVGDGYIYQVYRIRNPKEPMHSGNIQTNGTFRTEKEAEDWAAVLNEGEDDSDDVGNSCSEIPNNCENLQSTCNEVATDCISRQTTADEIGKRAERCAERFGTDDPFWEGLMIAKNIVECAQSAQPETAKRIVGKSKDGMTLWYQCDMCYEPVDVQDNFCRGCGRRLIDE